MSKSRTPVPITTDEDALLAGVWAAPHDDLPRLVYADWLDENGLPEQAEFIRVQCQLAALDAEWADVPPGLREREAELLRDHWAEWRAGLPAVLRDTPRRGFPGHRYETVTAAKFATLPDLPEAPLWDYVLEWKDPADLVRALAAPLAPRLRYLDLQPRYGWEAADVDALLASQHRLENVTDLRLVGTMTPPDIERLFTALDLPHLTTLDPPPVGMGSGPMSGADTVRVLDAARFAPQLKRLDLDNLTLNAAGVAALGCCEHFTALRSLRLNAGTASDKNLAAFVTAPALALVRDLDLLQTRAGDATAAAVAADPASARLRRLGIHHGRLKAAGFAALAGSEHLNSLRELWLAQRHQTAKVPAVIRDRFGGRVHPKR